MIPVALTIAGSDPSGGAGLQADLKTFHQYGVYGTSVVTLLTVQNTQRVTSVEVLSSQLVISQLDALLEDIPPTAAKTGALGNAAVIEAVAARAEHFSFPLVVDPVMISKHGDSLIDASAVEVLKLKLLPRAFLVTPNRQEAQRLSGCQITDVASMEKAAAIMAEMGAANVLIKGGCIDGNRVDLLWADGRPHELAAKHIETKHTHGTGCVLSAAITARLASGNDLITAVTAAKKFVTAAIQSSPGLGKGIGPVLGGHARWKY
jgi:hydroxymethylpyrimidine/phosphomethylpyrimidine kinase